MISIKVWSTIFRLLFTCQFSAACDKHIGVIFHEKSFITLPILFLFKPNLLSRCTFIPFAVCQILRKFDNVFYGIFCKCAKRRKTKEMNNFFKAHISVVAGIIYLRFRMCYLLICQHLQSKIRLFFFFQTRDDGTERA